MSVDMSKGKGRRGDRQFQRPAQLQATHRPAGASSSYDLVAAGLMLLALCATLYIWLYMPLQPQSQLSLTGMVWLVSILGALGRLYARRSAMQLRATLAHEQIVNARLEPDITEAQSGLHMRHVSTWLVAVLGIGATVLVWLTGAIEQKAGGIAPLLVGLTVSVMFALAVAANAVNRNKTKRLARDFRIALNSEELALGTLGGVEAMICACLPNGERTRFNERFQHFLGRSAEQLQGRGWLELVQADDRQCAVELAARPLSAKRGARQHDMCVRRASGERAWLRETLTPRFDEKGNLVEFICTAIDITAHVLAESNLDKQLGTVKQELAEATGELSKAKSSRNRFEKGLEEARDEVKDLRESLTKAENALAKTVAETTSRIKEIESDAKQRIKEAEEDAERRARKAEQAADGRLDKLQESARSAQQELQQANAENKKLARAFEKLQDEMTELRSQESESRAQVVRHIKESREAKAELTDTHTREAQQRAKIERLTQRCEELEKHLAGKDAQIAAAQKQAAAAQDQAQQAGEAAMAEVERRLHEVSAEALAKQLRKQIDGMQRMTSELLGASVAGPVLDAANNTAASLRVMSDLVDEALGIASKQEAAPENASPSAPAAGASFDLRRTAQGVRELLADHAYKRGVRLEVQIAPKLPALVHGEDVAVRSVLLSLTDAALHLVEDGTLVLRLSEDVKTGAHSTIRCEIRHATARVRNDALEYMMAIKATDADIPDAATSPVAHQAGKAWCTVRKLHGQHGYLMPDEGGFMVWFTFNLDRPGAVAGVVAAPHAEKSPPARTHGVGPAAKSAAAAAAAQRPQRAAKAAAPETEDDGAGDDGEIDDIEVEERAPVRSTAAARKRAADEDEEEEDQTSDAAADSATAEAPAPDRETMLTNALATNMYVAEPTQFESTAPRGPVSMPRMPQELLTCNLGEVMELGGDSMRVMCAKPPKQEELTINFGDVEPEMQLRATVAWCKKISGRKHDVGLKFVDVTVANQRRIMNIAMQHRRVVTMADGDEAR